MQLRLHVIYVSWLNVMDNIYKNCDHNFRSKPDLNLPLLAMPERPGKIKFFLFNPTSPSWASFYIGFSCFRDWQIFMQKRLLKTFRKFSTNLLATIEVQCERTSKLDDSYMLPTIFTIEKIDDLSQLMICLIFFHFPPQLREQWNLKIRWDDRQYVNNVFKKLFYSFSREFSNVAYGGANIFGSWFVLSVSNTIIRTTMLKH
jgi:hypothetical protein